MSYDETRGEASREDDDDWEQLREDDVLLSIDEVCAFIGGPAKPVHPSNVYRGIQAGIWHPPLHPTPGISRWNRRRLAHERARQTQTRGAK